MLLNLEKGSMVAVELGKQECLVQCRSGRLWITVAGDSRDYFLEGTEERLISGPGRVVIETLSGSCFGMHSESDITVKVNEEFCTPETITPRGKTREIKPRPFWKNQLTRPAIFRIESKITSA